jgi:hypothetical protein
MSLLNLIQDQQREGGSISSPFLAVRVREVILDGSREDLGGWNALGYIRWDQIVDPSATAPTSVSYAKPLFPNYKNYPLVNEIVFLVSLPDPDIQSDTNSESYYYFSSINLWNSIHHNAVPDNVNYSTLPQSQQKDYQTAGLGSVRRVSDKGTDIDLGKTFRESNRIYSLLPYEGDVIFEGRFGNSLRFSSTIPRVDNFWRGNSGPITILSNGHDPNLNQAGWLPTSESIDRDQSTVVLTSNQTLTYTLPVEGNGLQKLKVEGINSFSNPQAVISSDRVVLNAKNESIVASANQAITLAATNLSAEADENLYIDAQAVYLGLDGTTYPNQPVILGKEFLDDFEKLLTQLDTLASRLETLVSLPAGTPYTAISTAAVRLRTQIGKVDRKLKADTYKSKKVFTSK